MEKFILLLVVFVSIYSSAQDKNSKDKNSDKKKVRIITIDFITKSFENDDIVNHLEVNDWIQFRIKNAPKDLKYEGNLNYTNRNLELRSSFGGYLAFDKENELLTGKKSGKLDESIAENKENDEELDSIKKASLKTESKSSNNEFKDRKVDLKTMIEDLEINIAKKYLENSGKDAKKAIDDITWQQKLIKILYKNVNDRIIYKDNEIEKLSKKVDELNSKIDVETVTYYFPPVRIENYDFTQFLFILKNGDKIDNISIPFSNNKGFKLDFSTGFIFNGLQTQNYKLLALDSDNVVIKEEENGLSFNTGIALLAHAYSRSKKVTNLALTTGLSFNLNNQNLNYVLGGSVLLGEDQRFIISCGVTAGRVKELVKYYKIDEAIPNSELSISAQVPVVEKLKASWFLSLTYNLGIGDSTKTIKL